MKKIMLPIIAAAILLASGGAASAVAYYADGELRVEHLHQGSPGLFGFGAVPANLTTSGNFNIVSNGVNFNLINDVVGFLGGTDTVQDGYVTGTPIASATAYFLLSDAFGDETYTVDIGLSGGPLDWSFDNLGFFLKGGAISGSASATLQANGNLDWTLTATSGEFTYLGSALLVTVEDQPSQNVPDGGASAVLLGLGLLGLGAIRRKLA